MRHPLGTFELVVFAQTSVGGAPSGATWALYGHLADCPSARIFAHRAMNKEQAGMENAERETLKFLLSAFCILHSDFFI